MVDCLIGNSTSEDVPKARPVGLFTRGVDFTYPLWGELVQNKSRECGIDCL